MKVATLIAVFHTDQLHAIQRTQSNNAYAWCGTAELYYLGILFVPTWAFDGRGVWQGARVCLKCSAALCALAEAP